MDSEGKPRQPDWMLIKKEQKEQESKAVARAAKERDEIMTYVLFNSKKKMDFVEFSKKKLDPREKKCSSKIFWRISCHQRKTNRVVKRVM